MPKIVTNLLFLFMFIILSMASIFLLIKYRENRLIHWVAIILICGALAGLQTIIEKGFLPYISTHGDIQTIKMVTIFAGVLNFIINTFPYLAILIFFLIYNGIRVNLWIISALSVPIVITFFFYTDLGTNHLNVFFVACWGALYVISSGILAIRPIWIEKERTERMYHCGNAIILFIPLLCLSIFHFSPSFYSDQLLNIIPIVSIISVIIFISLYLRGSFLGIQRKALRSVHMGTTLLQHSVKNSIGKVKLNAINIRKNVQKGSVQEIDRFVENLLNIHDELMQSISQFTTVVDDRIHLNRQLEDLSKILDEIIDMLDSHPKIKAIKDYHSVELFLDKQLVTECLVNICNNAIEAMKGEGNLHIQLEQKKSSIILIISDTGPGMSTLQLQNVCEPFYSTKHRTGKNFGLGMFHVKKIIEAHKGKLMITSKPNVGTTVKIIFNLK